MKITVIGGGNIGTQFAVHCSQQNDTCIYTSTPEVFIPDIRIIDENSRITLTGKNIRATYDADIAFKNADYIFITYPAFMLGKIAEDLLPFAHDGLHIGIIPGTGGGECAFREHIKKGATLFGLQRVPSVARLTEKGKEVRAVGYRAQLYVAALPHEKARKIARTVEDIFGISCDSMPNYLNLTLTPSNPILHTTRLRTLFGDYRKGVFYDRVPLFYEEWNDESSELLFKCDAEVQQICAALSEFDLSFVKSLKDHYENHTIQGFTAKLRSITGFKGLPSPMIQTDRGYIPDFSSRYFSADFPYGLSILVQIGEFLGLNISNMKETLEWYRKVSDNTDEFSFADFGINDLESFLKFYRT